MKEQDPIEVRGFGFGQVVVAALAGATAGAALAYFTAPAAGRESRRRLRAALAGTRDGVERVPAALARASEAARAAFLEAIDGQATEGNGGGKHGPRTRREREAPHTTGARDE